MMNRRWRQSDRYTVETVTSTESVGTYPCDGRPRSASGPVDVLDRGRHRNPPEATPHRADDRPREHRRRERVRSAAGEYEDQKLHESRTSVYERLRENED